MTHDAIASLRMPHGLSDADMALQRLWALERERAQEVCFTQPFTGAATGAGEVRDYTWGQAIDQARRMAAYLQAQGYPAGSCIAILSKNCAHWMMADWAIFMAGYVSVPLYPTLAPDTIRQILTHSESRLLFVGKLDGWEHMKEGVPAGLPCISTVLSPPNNYTTWEDIVAKTAPIAGHPVRAADELATIMYTSGTTGTPKGVMHSFSNLAWAAKALQERVDSSVNDRMLSYLPLAHVAERMGVEMVQLRVGMRLYFAESLDTFTVDLQRCKPTIFFSVPRLWVKFQQKIHEKMPPAKLQRLLRIPLLGRLVRRKILKALGLDECRVAAGGAAPMPAELLNWYEALGLDMVEVYGMTENAAISHSTLPGQPRPGTVGTTYPGVESRLEPTSGEIQIRNPALMLGYYKAPDITSDAFSPDGWLKTGDKGALDANGDLRITGRVKDLFKTSKGKYVAPAPIEDRLVMHASLEACCVAGANLGQPLGLVMLNPEWAAKIQNASVKAQLEVDLMAHLDAINSPLDPHEQLACLVVVRESWTVDTDFVTPTFKVKRNRVEDTYAPHYAAWEAQRKKVIWA